MLRRASRMKPRPKPQPNPSLPTQSKSPSMSKSPPQSKSPSQSKSPPRSPADAKDQTPEQKFATLPRGFKSKAPHHPTAQQALAPQSKDKGINQEIEGMMSAIKAVDRAITKEEQEIRLLRDSLTRSLPEEKEEEEEEEEESEEEEEDEEESGRGGASSPRPVTKEIVAVPPEQVLSPSVRDRPVVSPDPVVSPGPATHIDTQPGDGDLGERDRKKSQLEIVLNNKPGGENKRASYAEIKLTSPSSRDPPSRPPEYRDEVRHNVGGIQGGGGDSQLQRAKRERIIPIMLEDDDDDDDDTTTSETLPPHDRCGVGGVMPPSVGPGGVSQHTTPPPPPLSHHHHHHLPGHPSDPRSPLYQPSPETIRKSRRERIIPIAVEGEGLVTPPVSSHSDHQPPDFGHPTQHHHPGFTHDMTSRHPPLNGQGDEGEIRGGSKGVRVMSPPPPHHYTTTRTTTAPSSVPPTWSRRLAHTNSRSGFLEHSDSFSSAGEEEEDEDDGFQILTAESLFSTLLNRVRSLTRKMNQDEGRGGVSGGPGMGVGGPGMGVGGPRRSGRPTPEPATAPPTNSASAAGFWSSLYNSPRDSPARRLENLSRGSLVPGRDDDGFAPLWPGRPASVSRDTSDADTLFSDASATSSTTNPFGTLPRVRTMRHSLHLPPPQPPPTLTPRLFPDSLFLNDFPYPS